VYRDWETVPNMPELEGGARVAQPLAEESLVEEASVEEVVVETDRGEDAIANTLMLLEFTFRRQS
jgi:hypothetical protein